MTDLIPLTQMLATGVPAFVVGVLVGRYQERHKETIRMDFANSFRVWYDRWAPLFVTLTAILAVVGIWIGTAATITNARQDASNDAATKAVQRCFDRYAQAQSMASKAVRVATAAKDEATADRDRALQALTDSLIAQRPTEDIRAILADLDATGVRLVEAQVDLNKARAENPIPDAPSEFCSVKP